MAAGAATLLVMRDTCLSELQEQSEDLIYGRGIAEYLRHIGIKKNHVGPRAVSAEMFSPNPAREIIFGSHGVLNALSNWSIHTVSVLWASLSAR